MSDTQQKINDAVQRIKNVQAWNDTDKLRMREAKIIVPWPDYKKDGNTSWKRDFEKALCNMFGGFTREAVSGAWVNADHDIVYDSNYRYTVAMYPDKIHELVRLAKLVRRMTNEDCIYVSDFNGNAYFVYDDTPETVAS